MAVPYYVVFYVGKLLFFLMNKAIRGLFFINLSNFFDIGMSLLEGRKGTEAFLECKSKLIPTVIAGLAFWTPAQTFNFWMIPPIYRVSFMGVLAFLELNGLCLMKRMDL